jgi:hypothetical protein
MPYAKFDDFNANTGAAVSIAVPNSTDATTTANGIIGVKPVSGLLTVVTADAYLVFNAANAAAAATAMTNGNAAGNNQAMIIPAGTVIELRNIDPTTTWIRSGSATGGLFSFMGF